MAGLLSGEAEHELAPRTWRKEMLCKKANRYPGPLPTSRPVRARRASNCRRAIRAPADVYRTAGEVKGVRLGFWEHLLET